MSCHPFRRVTWIAILIALVAAVLSIVPQSPLSAAPVVSDCVVEIDGGTASLDWVVEDDATSYAVRSFTNDPASTRWVTTVNDGTSWTGDHVEGRGYVIRALPSRNETTCTEGNAPVAPPAPAPATGCTVEVVGGTVSRDWVAEDGASSYAVRSFTNDPGSTRWVTTVNDGTAWTGDHVDGRGYVIRAIPSRNEVTCVEGDAPGAPVDPEVPVAPPADPTPTPGPATGCVVEIVGGTVSLDWVAEDGATSYAVRLFTDDPAVTRWVTTVNDGTSWSGDHVDGRGYVIRALPSRNEVTCVEGDAPEVPETPEVPVDETPDAPLLVPALFATSDGTSDVEIGWIGVGVDVEVFRNGVSLGISNTGTLVDTTTLSPTAVTYTAQSIGADGSRSELSEPISYIARTAGECVAVALNDETTAITWVNGVHRPVSYRGH